MVSRPPKRKVLDLASIKEARRIVGIDQAKLARLSGITRKTVSVIERSEPSRIDARRRVVLEKIRETFEIGYGLQFTFSDSDEGGVSISVRSAKASEGRETKAD
jgi:DNA-binding XRE family transcriptional regulator